MIPNNFITESENSIASYSFYDLATGTGYKTLYVVWSFTGAVSGATLIPEALYSRESYSQGGVNTAVDLDIDLPIETNMVLEGDCLINMPCAIMRNTTSQVISANVSLTLKHVDGAATETTLGSAITETLSGAAASDTVGNTNFWIMVGKVAVPRTPFVAGDTLRLTLAVDAMGANNYFRVYHDPQGLDVTATVLSNDFLVNIPLRVPQ